MLTRDTVIARNNVTLIGSGPVTLMFGHGFGCDQSMWQYLIEPLRDRFTLVLFDYVGSGRSQLSAYRQARYRSLEGYARDITEICATLDLNQVHFVGHSVSASIGLLAAVATPERFASQIMVCPSPCFLNMPPDYQGGFERADLEELVALMDRNYIGWANYLAPLVMGGQSPEALTDELSESFCSTDPLVAKTFAHATFFADYRHMLPRNLHPTLILQSQVDAMANETVGHYMQAHMPHSALRVLPSEGHCVHMTHPHLVLQEIEAWLDAQVI